ncbi:MAG TPA: NAD(P)/FAD-dependent oxidoreductase [Microlunatus sp.]
MPTPAVAGAEQGQVGDEVPTDACDVLVIGGGPAGLATAIGLRTTTGVAVVVAEARTSPTERFGETLTPGALAALDRLGLADAFHADGHLRCPGGISVWGRARPGHSDHVLDPLGPAWHLDRRVFEARLRVRADEVGVDVRTGTRALDTRPVDGRTVVRLDDGSRAAMVRPRWVVDATGSGSWFARRHGATRRTVDRLVAVLRIADLEAGAFTAQTAVEATPTGWWYGSRLPGDRVVTALVTERNATAPVLRDGGRRWHDELAATTLLGPLLAGVRLGDAPLHCRPVTVSLLDRVIGPGWLAVGDAASERDPITGSGIHDALLDAADAGWTIAAALGEREPPPWRYEDRVRSRFDSHVATRAALYASEQRWSTESFWRHRRAAPTVNASGRS